MPTDVRDAFRSKDGPQLSDGAVLTSVDPLAEITRPEEIQGSRVTLSEQRLRKILGQIETTANRAIETATNQQQLRQRVDELDSKGTAIAKIEAVHRYGRMAISLLVTAVMAVAGGSYAYVRSSGEAAGESRAKQARIVERQDFLQHEVDQIRADLRSAIETIFSQRTK
jgi:cytochrome c-type biogenesis protein CcmH/NrfG